MHRRIRFAPLAMVVALFTLLAACAGPAAPSGPASSQPATKITYLTSFGQFGRDSYAYVAKEKGYFAAEGLDVEIKAGSGTVEVAKLVASGQADFGAGDFPTAVITIANEGLPITTTSMIHQNSLAAVITLEGRGISKAQDLAGKKIADTRVRRTRSC